MAWRRLKDILLGQSRDYYGWPLADDYDKLADRAEKLAEKPPEPKPALDHGPSTAARAPVPSAPGDASSSRGRAQN
jgi:hypothetical protein